MDATALLAALSITDSALGGTDDCWPWPRGKTAAGYGRHRGGYVHRIAFEVVHGPIPARHHVHHECHTRACFNPRHLVAVAPAAHAQEHADAPSCVRGHPYPESKRPGRNDCAVCHREDQRARGVPTPARVRAARIRALRAEGLTLVAVAAEVGVSLATVKRTVHGRVYADA